MGFPFGPRALLDDGRGAVGVLHQREALTDAVLQLGHQAIVQSARDLHQHGVLGQRGQVMPDDVELVGTIQGPQGGLDDQRKLPPGDLPEPVDQGQGEDGLFPGGAVGPLSGPAG